ncbi:ornithine cyclodeaminase family protein [Terrilactibacillus sp. BCM23-1]|uniref:Ornithine cyclodeaminase family protein n=1 Tax=Terrilactibacillus tamarindi TaxID=2599694 RepID=A0A6N8CNX2_9BACI|nr:ornithine cyclodeaminase family protein [Terrilactibacillus tamarindi]MTT31812.1 ornithine cyclodeaminase family protein [Terrilactibacillus tamarindi]
MIFLSEQDILSAVTIQEMMDTMELAYLAYENQAYLMPIRTQVSNQESDSLLFMPCFSKDAFGSKIVTVFPNNSIKKMPTTQGLMILNDSQTGEVLSIMNGTSLTALRTGALGGVAIRYLGHPKAKSIGLIGTGMQGKYQLMAALAARDISDIYLYNRTQEKLFDFIEDLKQHIKKEIHIHPVENQSELISQSDIIITATTSSTPVLPDDKDLLRHKLFIGIGSYQPSMQEFPKAIYNLIDHLYIDTKDAIKESGDIINPISDGLIERDQIIPFSKRVAGKQIVTDEEAEHQTFAFKSVGMALFDVFAAEKIYKNAIGQKLGQIVLI